MINISLFVHTAYTPAVLILRCFHSRDPFILNQAFCVYVGPLLEFFSQVWSLHHKYLIDKVKSVQRFFTKRFSWLRGLYYCERLNNLGFQTLECRRFISDLTLCYNILHGLCDTSWSINLSNSVTRGSCLKLVKPTCSSDIRKYFFTSRLLMFGVA